MLNSSSAGCFVDGSQLDSMGDLAGAQDLPLELLRCPVTKEPLHLAGDSLEIPGGLRRYPVVDGVPIVIDEERSVFNQADYTQRPPSLSAKSSRAWNARVLKVWQRVQAAPPTLSRNVGTEANYKQLEDRLVADGASERRPRVLIVGGATLGTALEGLVAGGQLDLIETDVALGPRTQIVCDGQDLPFKDGAFDAAICQAVLEHVADPYRVVSEMHRVLQPGGLVYSEIPFMQQVHEGAHDFTRFTPTGHRRLYRCFDEISSGAQGGPGMALAWSLRYFLLSFARRRVSRALIRRLSSYLFFWLKYFDDLLVKRPGGLDAASGTFFLGRRREDPVSDREVLRSYRGAVRTPGISRAD
jgi:SAM-dependent methyltransferase/uncharacterized protein YbaR (Trm112 family)